MKFKKLHILILLLAAITLFVRLYLINFYKSNAGGVDQNVIYGLQRLLAGQPLYQNPELPPFAIIQYTPLYYHIVAGIGRLLQIQATDAQSVYILSRVCSLLCNLATVLIVAFSINIYLKNLKQSFLFALPVLMIFTVHYYVRVDSLEFLLFCMGIYAFLKYLAKEQLSWLLLAAATTALCILSKQNGVLLALLLSVYLAFYKGQWARAVMYGLVSLAVFSCVLWWLTGGDYMPFYQNTYLGIKNGVDYYYPLTIFISQFYYDFIPWYFLCFISVWYFLKKYPVPDPQRFIIFSAIFSFFFAVITGLKIGSSNNYFTEFLTLMIIFLPFLLQHPQSGKKLFTIGKKGINLRSYAVFCLVVLMASKTIGLFSSVFIERWFKEEEELYASALDLRQHFEQRLNLQPTERIYFSPRHFLDNVFFGQTFFPTKDVVNIIMEYNPGVFDYSHFTDSMNKGLVNYIVTDTRKPGLNEQHEYIPFIQFDSSRFRQIDSFAQYRIYKFRGLNNQ